jgi:2'-5' RNA ligase
MNDNVTAVDIVILPPREISELAVSLSEKIDGPYVLNFENRFPHMTLAMAYVEDLEEVKAAVAKIASAIEPFEVNVAGLINKEGKMRNYNNSSSIKIENSSDLSNLQIKVFDSLSRVNNIGEAGAFFADKGEVIRSAAIDYVKNFKEKKSGNNFWPHITLGLGSKPFSTNVDIPKGFEASEIALCQLGNFCTCRKVLGRWKLGSNYE